MNTVLLLDDDDSYRELVLLTLEDQCQVACALGFADGESLLAHLQQPGGEQPELVILDLHLGGMSGLEVLRKMVALGVRCPVAILTGAGDASERQACLDTGAVAVIVKPVAYAELVSKLKQLVAQTRQSPPQD